MYRHHTLVIHLDSVAQQASLDTIAHVIKDLQNRDYAICVLSKSHEICASLQQLVNIQMTKTYGSTPAFERIINQLLTELETTSLLVVGSHKELIEAADQTKCLSIGSEDRGRHPDFCYSDFNQLISIVEKIDSIFSAISRTIIDKKKPGKPLLIGVNGVDTSGKSRFTTDLSRYLDQRGLHTQIIRIDDYHHLSEIRYAHPDPVVSYYENAFNLQLLESELLRPVSTENAFGGSLHHLDLENDTFSIEKEYMITPHTIVLIEGVLLFRQPIDQYLDLRIYLQISFDEVLRRAKIRDGSIFGDRVVDRYTQKYIPIQKKYIAEVSPLEMADLVIDNEDYFHPMLVQNTTEQRRDSDITLHPLGEEHLAELECMLLEPEATSMLGVIAPPTLEDYHEAKAYAIYSDGVFAGLVELFRISWRNRRAELSLCVKESLRNAGVGYQAIKEILRIGFMDLGLYKVNLRVLENNLPALRLYEKSGFTREGVCRSESLRSGEFLDQIQMSILLPEWIDTVKDS